MESSISGAKGTPCWESMSVVPLTGKKRASIPDSRLQGPAGLGRMVGTPTRVHSFRVYGALTLPASTSFSGWKGPWRRTDPTPSFKVTETEGHRAGVTFPKPPCPAEMISLSRAGGRGVIRSQVCHLCGPGGHPHPADSAEAAQIDLIDSQKAN